MQGTQHLLETVVQESSHSVYELSEQMIRLEVIQGAVARLLERIDDIVHKGWDKDRGMACLAIDEIRDTVRLIDMGFLSLFKEMSEEVKTLTIHADELFEMVIRNESKQSTQATTRLDINSVEGWNAFAMEGNIKTFIKEFDREPESIEEVLTYINETVAKVMAKKEENKKADALTSTKENIAN